MSTMRCYARIRKHEEIIDSNCLNFRILKHGYFFNDKLIRQCVLIQIYRYEKL